MTALSMLSIHNTRYVQNQYLYRGHMSAQCFLFQLGESVNSFLVFLHFLIIQCCKAEEQKLNTAFELEFALT